MAGLFGLANATQPVSIERGLHFDTPSSWRDVCLPQEKEAPSAAPEIFELAVRKAPNIRWVDCAQKTIKVGVVRGLSFARSLVNTVEGCTPICG